ncbi:MAG: hypothetical protein RIS79_3035 [Verrucomicrobiota bacterium]|jgi:hypothetical protein
MLENKINPSHYRAAHLSSDFVMTAGSTTPHRAFMGVTSTFCVLLILILAGGWRWFFQDLDKRRVISDRARLHEARLRDLEKLGLDAEAGILTNSSTPDAPTVSLQEMAPKEGSTDGVIPLPGAIQDLPLQENAPDYQEALKTLGAYWKAITVKERLSYVHHPEQVKPWMEDYYERQHETDPDHTELKQKSRFMLDGKAEILYFNYASSRPTGFAEVAMRRGANGKFLVDWESLTGYSSSSFSELKKLKPAEPSQVRTFVKLFEYYNYEFEDSSRFVCVKMIASNGVDILYGYCERDTELGRWLLDQLTHTRDGNMMSGYTLKIAYPENAQSDQCVWIKQVVASRWLLLD